HEHRALLHSLLPKEAIQKLQAEFHWENHDGAQQGMVGSGTPAEMILSFTQDILLGRLPDLPKVMAMRHALQQSLDVYQPLQADLTQRMAETENMDVEVRDALMLQLVGRRAEAEAEEEWDQMSVPAESGCYASTDVNVHTLLTVSEEEVQAAGSHNLPVVKDPVGPVEGQEVQAADRHILPVCIRDQASSCLQPRPVLTNNACTACHPSRRGHRCLQTMAMALIHAAALPHGGSVPLHPLPVPGAFPGAQMPLVGVGILKHWCGTPGACQQVMADSDNYSKHSNYKQCRPVKVLLAGALQPANHGIIVTLNKRQQLPEASSSEPCQLLR
ncbi:calcium/calmodulin-dependent 3',5'-cyclic nucleotide phosphodiesterase 1B, partial [Haematococcus lacustris]